MKVMCSKHIKNQYFLYVYNHNSAVWGWNALHWLTQTLSYYFTPSYSYRHKLCFCVEEDNHGREMLNLILYLPQWMALSVHTPWLLSESLCPCLPLVCLFSYFPEVAKSFLKKLFLIRFSYIYTVYSFSLLLLYFFPSPFSLKFNLFHKSYLD